MGKDELIEGIFFDTRKIARGSGGLFVALNGNSDGHIYIPDAYAKGVRSFILESEIDRYSGEYSDANFYQVVHSVEALQNLAKNNRQGFKGEHIFGITGSNGKTIVKEWLWNILVSKWNVYKSPKSYNSQIGVPISMLGLDQQVELGIFEAGISRPAEMEKLASIIQPDIGIFTNIGPAHDEGFESTESKVGEKLMLFKDSDTVIYRGDQSYSGQLTKELSGKNLITWGKSEDQTYMVDFKQKNGSTTIEIQGVGDFEFGLNDQGSLENIAHAIVASLSLGLSPDSIRESLKEISPVELRLDIKKGISGCKIINDAYNLDLNGFRSGLDSLMNQSKAQSRTLILTDFPGKLKEEDYEEVVRIINKAELKKFIGIGSELEKRKTDIRAGSTYFIPDLDSFKKEIGFEHFKDETILITGARKFKLEKLVPFLEERIHGTKMEIDLDGIGHNLEVFRQMSSSKRTMVMVKGSGYGAGMVELAEFLERSRIDYLGVAYVDEGVELRKAGIGLPIMVLNPTLESFELMMEKNLEPEIFSWDGLERIQILQQQIGKGFGIHLNIDTGMHRLGFDPGDVERVAEYVRENHLEVKSVFSHLSSSDDQDQEEFSKTQIETFIKESEKFKEISGLDPLLHICNTTGIINFPKAHLDMVRLGIGLYGIDPSSKISNRLEPCVALKTEISQTKRLQKGDPVGYGQKGRMPQDGFIATLPIGYADGFPRSLGNGKANVFIHEKPYPVIGNVCMDMIMVYLGEENYPSGSPVEIFGREISLEEFSSWQNTIPYEVLTQVGPRVKRIYLSSH